MTRYLSITRYQSKICLCLHHCISLYPQEWQITRLSHEYDSEPFGKERDAAIQKLATDLGVEVIVRTSHTLYNLDK